MKLIIIVAVSDNGVIGKNGKIPWHSPKDMEYFRRCTTGHSVIMGRRTWESLPERFRPLPGRKNIVLSRNLSFIARGADATTSSLQNALTLTKTEDLVFVIGGASLYQEALSHADEVWITRIHIEAEGDVFFPQSRDGIWTMTEQTTERDGDIEITFERYVRKTVNLENARNDAQRDVMQRFETNAVCPFCSENIDAAELNPVLEENDSWHVRLNRWPYNGSKMHFLLILRRHAERIQDISPKEWEGLRELLTLLEEKYEITGASLGIRFGDIALTGATVSHLHAHIIVPDENWKGKRLSFAMGPKP